MFVIRNAVVSLIPRVLARPLQALTAKTIVEIERVEEEMTREGKDEESIRQYLQAKHILSVPVWMKRYTYQPMPAYMKPLEGVSEADDFTGPSRLNGGIGRVRCLVHD
jgi:hypothetical protein